MDTDHSMFDEIAIDFLHDNGVELFQQQVVVFLGGRELEFLFFSIRYDILADQIFQLISVLQIRVFADNAIDSVEVEILQQFFQERSNFRVYTFFLLVTSFLLGRFSHLFQKFLILLLDNDSSINSRQSQVFIRSDDHPFNNVLFQFRQSQKRWNGGIQQDIHVEYLFKSSLEINRNARDIIFEKLRDIQYINPVDLFISDDVDIEGEKFVIRSVVNTLLNLFWPTFDVIGILNRPVASKVLAIDCKFDHFWIILLDTFVNIWQLIVKFGNQFPCIIKRLIEIPSRIFTRDRNFLSQEISSPSIADSLSIEENGEVRSMDFFGGDPQDILIIIAFLPHKIDKFVSSGQLQAGVFVKCQSFILSDLLVLFLLHLL